MLWNLVEKEKHKQNFYSCQETKLEIRNITANKEGSFEVKCFRSETKFFSEWRIFTWWTVGKLFIFSLDKKLSKFASFDSYC